MGSATAVRVPIMVVRAFGFIKSWFEKQKNISVSSPSYWSYASSHGRFQCRERPTVAMGSATAVRVAIMVASAETPMFAIEPTLPHRVEHCSERREAYLVAPARFAKSV